MRNLISRDIPCEMKTSIIKIYSYENHNFFGTFEAPIFGDVKKFKNLTQLILLFIELLNKTNLIQAMTNYEKKARKSLKKSRYEAGIRGVTSESEAMRKTPIATFKVKIIFQQYGSWQGTITWNEKNKEQHFRSALELILLMDGAMSALNHKTELVKADEANAV